jgi:hypothetical protein
MPRTIVLVRLQDEDELDGLPLATFSRRAVAFGIDFVLISPLRKPAEFVWAKSPERLVG